MSWLDGRSFLFFRLAIFFRICLTSEELGAGVSGDNIARSWFSALASSASVSAVAEGTTEEDLCPPFWGVRGSARRPDARARARDGEITTASWCVWWRKRIETTARGETRETRRARDLASGFETRTSGGEFRRDEASGDLR